MGSDSGEKKKEQKSDPIYRREKLALSQLMMVRQPCNHRNLYYSATLINTKLFKPNLYTKQGTP